jgi:hypothetical protein
MSRPLTTRRAPSAVCPAEFNPTPICIGAAIASILFGPGIPVKAAELDFSTGWTTEGDVQIESPTQVNLSTDGLADDDSDLGVGNGEFNFSGIPAALVGFGGLEDFLGIEASQLDLGGFAYEGSAIKTILTVSDRSQLSFDYNFLTNETSDVLQQGPFNDYGFVLIGQEVKKLADYRDTNKGSCSFGFDACTGVQKKSYILNPGIYTLAFGVIDIDDFVITSALSVSNVTLTPLPQVSVPEPNLVFGIFAIGGLGLRLLRTNKK